MLKPALTVVHSLELAVVAAHPIAGNTAAVATEFVGSTPCGEEARAFLGIANPACEQIT